MTDAQRKEFEKALPIERRLTHYQQTIVATLHADIFKHTFNMPSPSCKRCARTWFKWVEDLQKLYNQ